MRRMSQVLFVGCVLLLLIACGETVTSLPTSTSSSVATTPVPAATSSPTLLFRADWSRGLTDWQASTGWKVVDGNVQSDVSDGLSITIPYQLTASDYAVEFRLQVVSVPQDGGYFQFVADRLPERNGYRAYVSSLLTSGTHQFATHPAEGLLIDPLDAAGTTPMPSDYEPGYNWHTYRVEVRGSVVAFWIDNRRANLASSKDTPHLSNGPLRLQCGGVEIRISSLLLFAYL